MTKKNWLLLIGLLVLSTVYVIYFTDWFKPKVIRIIHVSRMNRAMLQHPRDGAKPDTMPVIFSLGYPYRLTELKVTPREAWATNHNAFPIWHLVSDSNSVPVKEFYYGHGIPGMRPAVAGSHAVPLEPGVTYHLMISAGSEKGEHDFEARAVEMP